jgi:hypothetical protein
LEPLGRVDHGEGLVWPVDVVVVNPGVHRLLGLGQGIEAAAGQQLGSEGLVEAFDLAGGGRTTDAGEEVGDAVVAADAVEQHLEAAMSVKSAGRRALLVVVRSAAGNGEQMGAGPEQARLDLDAPDRG